jgi:hypothetical protein
MVSHPVLNNAGLYAARRRSASMPPGASSTWNPAKAYPVPAGSYVRDLAGMVHWDGAKDTPCLLMLVGEGPMVTTPVKQ